MDLYALRDTLAGLCAFLLIADVLLHQINGARKYRREIKNMPPLPRIFIRVEEGDGPHPPEIKMDSDNPSKGRR